MSKISSGKSINGDPMSTAEVIVHSPQQDYVSEKSPLLPSPQKPYVTSVGNGEGGSPDGRLRVPTPPTSSSPRAGAIQAGNSPESPGSRYRSVESCGKERGGVDAFDFGTLQWSQQWSQHLVHMDTSLLYPVAPVPTYEPI